MPAFYWSYGQMEDKRGLEKMSMSERMDYLTPEEKDLNA